MGRIRPVGRIRQFLRKHRLPIIVLLALLVPGLFLSLRAGIRTGDWDSFTLNLGTDLLGASALYVLLQLFVSRESRKRQLIEQMGSTVHDVAIPAAEQLWRRGWLEDGSLKWAYLERADLQGAHLYGADLQDTLLWNANLQGAYLAAANLQGARLYGANLRGAYLDGADLQEASLARADLRKASLEGANLRGADLEWADLQGANLGEAEFAKDTTLPDGTKWVPDTDMARFTDPNHPEFWRSDSRLSPAYRGREQEQESE